MDGLVIPRLPATIRGEPYRWPETARSTAEKAGGFLVRKAFPDVLRGAVYGLLVSSALVGPARAEAAEPGPRRPDQKQAGERQAGGEADQPVRTPATRPDMRGQSRSRHVDHSVIPAGGDGGQTACSQCRRAACPQCRLADGQQHPHRQCQHGLCPAHCPVRPDVFGFYGTRWRRWPGTGVVQTSNDEAATPARPPKAEVPGAKEESLEPDAEDAEAEDLPAPAAGAPAAVPASPAEGARGEGSADEDPVEKGAALDREAPEDTPPLSSNSTPWRSFTADDRLRLAAQP
jgi:hypothetical protein